ncbi:MAG: helix-turn-helix domain-containing protein [Ardenticatenaceae bacterium]|nr:helix-turn-helix domain-containing protein [Ardenticatenaceae bacterium]
MAKSNSILTLRKAAARLDIHPATLRRWADQGDIPFMLTPGGHRRFAEDDIERFAADRKIVRKPVAVEKMWAEKALTRTRQDVAAREQPKWMQRIDSDLREKHRILGQRLLGLTLQYISSPDDADDLLVEAQQIGFEYGEISQTADMTVTEALQATLFFRDRLVETALQLPESVRIKPENNVRLMRRINKLLNTVQLAIATVYES